MKFKNTKTTMNIETWKDFFSFYQYLNMVRFNNSNFNHVVKYAIYCNEKHKLNIEDNTIKIALYFEDKYNKDMSVDENKKCHKFVTDIIDALGDKLYE